MLVKDENSSELYIHICPDYIEVYKDCQQIGGSGYTF